MTKGDLSGHVKSYHDNIRDKKYFAFSYGDKQEKATLLICSAGSEGWEIRNGCRKSKCLPKEIVLSKYQISKEVVKIKIKPSSNFQKKAKHHLIV